MSKKTIYPTEEIISPDIFMLQSGCLAAQNGLHSLAEAFYFLTKESGF